MNACICDKCGITMHNLNSDREVTTIEIYRKNQLGSKRIYKHLCTKCTISFNEWLKKDGE